MEKHDPKPAKKHKRRKRESVEEWFCRTARPGETQRAWADRVGAYFDDDDLPR